MVLVFSTNPIYVRERDESIVSTVVAVCQEVQSHGWAAGKIMWLEIYKIKYKEIVHSPLSSTWNCYGAEFRNVCSRIWWYVQSKKNVGMYE